MSVKTKPNLLECLFLLSFISMSLNLISKPTRSEELNQWNILNEICLASFNSAMKAAGEKPPKGMGNFTCNCFLKEIGNGLSIDKAKEKCKQLASKNYSL